MLAISPQPGSRTRRRPCWQFSPKFHFKYPQLTKSWSEILLAHTRGASIFSTAWYIKCCKPIIRSRSCACGRTTSRQYTRYHEPCSCRMPPVRIRTCLHAMRARGQRYPSVCARCRLRFPVARCANSRVQRPPCDGIERQCATGQQGTCTVCASGRGAQLVSVAWHTSCIAHGRGGRTIQLVRSRRSTSAQ